ncbi:MAG: plasmid maintenance system killer [Candidatus Vogelbacteria bacterium CG10_big_fil_rev_8_21_14_0_10_45_14]|uniref:Plasmid maintenance system killer n=1 Tax=Candidatus Vogelbacteria bacterium CG10_big_fil_rev_8_21_14_0_10_45_14 TaxID=1975042 RepID=A0A2H0RL02_9BACT|nr:MAG: plasmid maintenance system killer [Candidatus Vogelbacteria bacterium CG10_big_fil_rev_8_21_14_0_10_45_14]
MIKSFHSKEEELIFKNFRSKVLPSNIQRVALRKLLMIDASVTVNDLRIPPANHLELLRGDRKGQYSIRINREWRICFSWREGSAHDVEIFNYH